MNKKRETNCFYVTIHPMSSIQHNKKQYDLYGMKYHEKRKNPSSSFWNDYLDFPALKELLQKEVKKKKVLDLGCGSGIFTRKLKDWGAIVTGLDNSKTMIHLAREENPDIEFYLGNALKTSFPNQSFDIVASAMMMHYLKNLRPLFKEVNRILKKNGLFVFSFHHPFNECLERKIKKREISFIVTPYFHNKSYRWKMAQNMELISFHHTFENIINNLNDTGFLIQQLLESRPPLSSKKIDPYAYQLTRDHPSFSAIKAIKSQK